MNRIDVLEETKRALNCLISQRIQYRLLIPEDSKRAELNEKYLKQDYNILEDIVTELDILKGNSTNE